MKTIKFSLHWFWKWDVWNIASYMKSFHLEDCAIFLFIPDFLPETYLFTSVLQPPSFRRRKESELFLSETLFLYEKNNPFMSYWLIYNGEWQMSLLETKKFFSFSCFPRDKWRRWHERTEFSSRFDRTFFLEGRFFLQRHMKYMEKLNIKKNFFHWLFFFDYEWNSFCEIRNISSRLYIYFIHF
jgi:hypothetical protein